jgi:UPF0755 protein
MTVDQRGGAVRSILGFAALLALVAIVAAVAGGWYLWREAERAGPHDAEKILLLESGSSVIAIGRELEEIGAIRDARLFIGIARAKGVTSTLKAGEYAVPAGASILEILELLVDGKSILHYVTAPEGLTTAAIIKIVAANAVLVGEISETPPEGSLLPETYAFMRGKTRADLISEMRQAQQALIGADWPERAVDLPIATPEEALILASIVEKETGESSERARIAGVFVNRLRKGMRLESDPTIIYGLTKGEPLGRGLRLSELKSETPYNTYVIRGLPPTPIANPGRASIEAVLHPAETEEIFFVADGTGGHAFAVTLEDHNRNVARWRQVERERREEG